MQFPVLHTHRLSLIAIQQNHLSDLFKLFGDSEVVRFYNLLPFTVPEDGQKLIDWYHARFEHELGIRWGIALQGSETIIGTIGFNNYAKNHKASIGYDLQKEYWGKGYVTEALKTVINYGFEELGVNRIEAEIMLGNIGSGKVLEKLNFTREGVLRQWMLWNNKHYDMIMYSLLKEDWE